MKKETLLDRFAEAVRKLERDERSESVCPNRGCADYARKQYRKAKKAVLARMI